MMAESRGSANPLSWLFSGPTASPRTRYYCHACMAEVPLAPTADHDDSSALRCARCNGDFIEELDQGSGESETPMEVDESQQEERQGPRPPALARASHVHSPMPGTFVIRFSSGREEGRAVSHTPHPSRGQAPQPPMWLPGLLNALSGFGGINLAPAVRGNPGDYVWGPGGLDAIITQLLNNVEGAGPPPADEQLIERLPTVNITANQVDKNIECSVCFDDFKLGEKVKVLPCRHHYHRDCIVPWLQRHGTCPVCRKDLQGGDTTTTEFDANIGETLGSIPTEQVEGEGTSADGPPSPSQNANNSARQTSSWSGRADRRNRPNLQDDDID